jgi:uncharacterized metal-binding protein YceD (DUF177 family)
MTQSALPLSRPLRLSEIPPTGKHVEIVADADERQRLAQENGLVALHALTADLDVRHAGRSGWRVTGTVHAEIRQTCVISLDDFDAVLQEPVDVRFTENEEASAGEEEDPPDPVIGGAIDLGALVTEFFVLGIDPHPRKPGVVFEGDGQSAEERSPFAVLKGILPPDRPDGSQ